MKGFAMLRIIWSLILFSITSYASPPEISVQPIGMSEEEHTQLKESILLYSNVQSLLRNKIFRAVELEIDDLDKQAPQYNLHVYDYSDDQMFEIIGPMNRSTSPQIKSSREDIPATPEEIQSAIQILNEDPEMGPLVREGGTQTYEPMPATTWMNLRAGGNRSTRLINVGVRSANGAVKNEIVGVDLLTKKVVHFPNRAPDNSLAAEQVCGLPDAHQATTAKGTRGSANIEVKRDNRVIWKFTVVRPAASSGRYGSGLEIRDLFYKGVKVLTRAHTPILNVQYEANRCGPFRDWAYSENPFQAVGTDRAPGIRVTTTPPQTIFDTQNDRGSFRGVAIYPTEDRITLTTEMSAGWYRYVSRFELYNDGTIRPIFQFSAVENSCVCYTHNHHVYWRFDFDVNGTKNIAEVSNGSAFRVLNTEVAQVKSANNQSWRIRNRTTNQAYSIIPSANDGVADNYGLADVWMLRFASNQVDDASVRTSTRAGLNAFLSGASLVNQDLVMWYAGHFVHSHTDPDAEARPHQVGPTLIPSGWVP